VGWQPEHSLTGVIFWGVGSGGGGGGRVPRLKWETY
jgi:hypothetical protein